MSSLSSNSLRKAAILIASLDADSADRLLEQMGPEYEACVRQAVMQLDDFQPEEQQQVIRDFVNRNPSSARSSFSTSGVELDASLVKKLENIEDENPSQATTAEQMDSPFRSLHHIDPLTLAGILSREHPQTIAIVAAHLPAQHSADMLGQLPERLQTEVLIRVAQMDQLNPDVISDIESEMRSLLADRDREKQLPTSGLQAVSAILNVVQTTQRRQLVSNLAARDHVLARQLGNAQLIRPDASQPPDSRHATGDRRLSTPAPTARSLSADPIPQPVESRTARRSDARKVRFTDLEQLNDHALAQVLQACEPHATLLALAGASHAFVQRILRHLPPRDARKLEAQMQQLGPIRLDDIEHAQQRMASTAQQLMDKLQIAAPSPERFTVAA